MEWPGRGAFRNEPENHHTNEFTRLAAEPPTNMTHIPPRGALEHLGYRADIDGLRALAVVAVIFFHAGFKWFSGGYVGVDVFFVISGYLITSIILADKLKGTFSIASFYERRVRRILPALLFVMCVSLPFAWFLMLPDELKNFSQSLVAVSIFASNILFWTKSGYFDASGEENPLLHTWTLGVEEQYYLLFPIFILLFWRFGARNLAWIIACLALFSLILSVADLRFRLSGFFLAPVRAWELLLGSLLAFASSKAPIYSRVSRLQSQLLSGLGLVMILGSIFVYDETTPFPGYYALVPTVGTALILAFAQKDTFVCRALSFKFVVGVGLISYSAYLWHQPLFAFARIYSLTKPPEYLFVVLSFATLVLAYLTWRFVEVPFRNRRLFSRRQIFAAALFGSSAFIGLGLLGDRAAGFPGRLSAQQQDLLSFKYDYFKGYQEGRCFLMPRQNRDGFENCAEGTVTDIPSVFLWGDSHAAHLYPGLHKLLADKGRLTHLTASTCPPILDTDFRSRPSCRGINEYVFDRIVKEKPDTVILAAQWNIYDWRRVERTITQLRKAQIRNIEIVGPVAQWFGSLPSVLARFDLPFSKLPHHTTRGLNLDVGRVDLEMKEYLRGRQVNYISLLAILCDQNGCLTRVGDKPETMVSWDYGHLTDAGSEFLVAKFPNRIYSQQ